MKQVFTPILLLAMMCSLLANVSEVRLKTESPSLLNQKVPSFSAHTIDGKLIDSTYFKGKITLISFMFIGCPPCMKEAPALNEIYADISSDSLQMLCIAPHTDSQMSEYNSDTDNRYSQIRKNNEVASIPYPVIAECITTKIGRDPKAIGPECSTLSSKFYVSGYPVTMLVDRDGIVRKIYEGFSNDPTYPSRFKERLKTTVRQLAIKTK